MNFFPDEGSKSTLNKWLVLAVPFLYLVSTSIYSASQVPWGYQVDPEIRVRDEWPCRSARLSVHEE